MINFEMRCELQKPELLFKYSVLNSLDDDDLESTLVLPLPLFATLVTTFVAVVVLDGSVSKASPEKIF